MSGHCTLRIQTPCFTLHLEGDAELVRSGYEGIRSELLSRLRDSVAAAAQHAEHAPRAAGPPVRGQSSPEFVWVYRSNDLYHKVHVVERSRLFATGLGRYLRPGRLDRIYLESEHAPLLEGLIPPGKTLWSELTDLGRVRLQKG